MTEPYNPYDRGAKLLSRSKPRDFLAIIFPDISTERIRIEDAELTLPDKRSDHVFIVDEKIVVCLEFMITPDRRRLRAFMLEAAILAERWPGREVLTAVYYLTRGGFVNVPDKLELCTSARTEFAFTAIRLWEHSEDIGKGSYPGLVPFLSLWSDGDKAVLERVRELILTEPDPAIRSDLLSIAVMVAGRVFKDRKWLLEYFREEWTMLKESWVVEEWIQEGIRKGIEQGRTQGIEQGRTQGIEQGRTQGIEQGRTQGIEQGIEQGLRQAVISALRTRFEMAPHDLIRALAEVSELALLEQLHDIAIRSESLDEFRRKMSLVLGE
jgi:hypothetical protein